jgi:hypothetical protein
MSAKTTSKRIKSRAPKPELMKLAEIFGPPPVLRTENPRHYDTLYAQFMSCFKPRDVFEMKQVRDMVDAGWLQIRYTHHQTVGVERWHRQTLQYQAGVYAGRVGQKSEALTQRPVVDTANTIDEVLSRRPTEFEHNRALEKSMPFQVDLEKLIASATFRFHKALELFEHYREGLGERLREKAEKIIDDAEYEVVDEGLPQSPSPSLAPSEEGSDDVETQDSSESKQ